MPAKRPRGSSRGAKTVMDFIRDVLDMRRLPVDFLHLTDVLREGAEKLTGRLPGMSLAVWAAHPGKDLDLVHKTGDLAEADLSPLEIAEEGDNRAALDFLAARGLKSARFLRWGTPAGSRGLILTCRRAKAEGKFSREALDVLASYFTAAAYAADGLTELNESRLRLEGGLSVLHQVASTISFRQSRPGDMLSAIVSIVAKALEADLCAFLLYDERSGDLVTQPGGYGLTGDEGALYRIPVTNEKSSSVRTFLTGVPFITGDAQNDPRSIAHFAKLWRCHSIIVVPLTLESKRIGVMRVGSFKKDHFSQAHLELLQLIAEEAAILVEGTLLARKTAEANQRLAEINQLKDEFVSAASHEFKTPLTAVKGFLSVVLDGGTGPLTEEQRRVLAIARSATDRLNALVTDLLDLSRLEAGASMDFSSVSLGELIQGCLRDHAAQAQQRSIQMSASVPERLPMVRGDAKWLRQALDHLASNAIKFTMPGGAVGFAAADKGEIVQVTVRDSGVGISPDDQKLIFNKFYRANNRDLTNPSGTGLGLAIVKFIADKHEGRVWVESELGKGSRFHLALPVVKDSSGIQFADAPKISSERAPENGG